MIRTWPGAALALLAIVAFNAYRQGGIDALRSWVSKVFLNKPFDRPEERRRGTPIPATAGGGGGIARPL